MNSDGLNRLGRPLIVLGPGLADCVGPRMCRACSSVWLERTPDKREVGSSSLPRPIEQNALLDRTIRGPSGQRVLRLWWWSVCRRCLLGLSSDMDKMGHNVRLCPSEATAPNYPHEIQALAP